MTKINVKATYSYTEEVDHLGTNDLVRHIENIRKGNLGDLKSLTPDSIEVTLDKASVSFPRTRGTKLYNRFGDQVYIKCSYGWVNDFGMLVDDHLVQQAVTNAEAFPATYS